MDLEETAEVSFVVSRVLRAIELSDPEHFQRIWSCRDALLPGYHALSLSVGAFFINCDTRDTVRIYDRQTIIGKVDEILFKAEFAKNPLKPLRVYTYQRDRVFQEVMPELDRVLVLDTLSLL